MPHSIFIFNVLDYPFYFKYLVEVCKIQHFKTPKFFTII